VHDQRRLAAEAESYCSHEGGEVCQCEGDLDPKEQTSSLSDSEDSADDILSDIM
jgi:hypothetical protein